MCVTVESRYRNTNIFNHVDTILIIKHVKVELWNFGEREARKLKQKWTCCNTNMSYCRDAKLAYEMLDHHPLPYGAGHVTDV